MKKLGVCSWSLRPTQWIDLVERVEQCGLFRVQIALEPFLSGGWDCEEVKEQLQASKIMFASGMMETVHEDYSTLESIKRTGGIRCDEHWDENQRRAQKHAEVARSFGLDLVTFHAGFIPEANAVEYQRTVDRIQRIAEIFGKHEVRLGLETGQEHAEDLLELLANPGLSHVGINFDPANMLLYGMGDPAKAIDLLRDRIVQVHMKDGIKAKTVGTWGEEVPAGEGQVDWESFFETVSSLSDRVHVFIERESGTQRVQDIIKAKEIALSYGCQQ